MAVFTTYKQGNGLVSDAVSEATIKAKRICEQYYQTEKSSMIPGGVHATHFEVVKKILVLLIPSNIKGKNVWEIGVGYPRFASILSTLSEKPVLCNDLRKFSRLLNSNLVTIY